MRPCPPTGTVEACQECTDRNWDENEGPVVFWDECGGTEAPFAEVDAESSDQSASWKWRCMECSAAGPMAADILAPQHDCKSRGPFDEVSRLLVEPVAESGDPS